MRRSFFFLVIALFASLSIIYSQPRLDKIKELISQNSTNDALAACLSYVQSNTRDENGWLLLAKIYKQIGKLDSAEIAAKKSVNIEDDFMEGYAVLANIQRAMNKNLEAVATARAGLKKTKKRQPEYPPLLVELGWGLLNINSIDEAQVAAFKAKELVPNNFEVYEILGDAYTKQKVTPMAISNYDKALEIDSSQYRILYKLAEIYKSEREYTSAAQVYSKILDLDTKNDKARFELATLFFRAKQYVKCVQTLKLHFDTNQPAPEEIQAIYLESLFLSKQYALAFEMAKKFLKVKPESPVAQRALAYGYMIEKDYIKAIDAFNKLSKIDSLVFDDYRWLGSAYRQVKKDSLAVAAYEKAITDSTQSNVNISFLLGEIGSIWMKFKEWEKAAYYFEKRIQIDSAAVSASINYANCMIQLEKFDKAIAALKRAIERNPNYAPAYVNLGFSYFQNKEFDAGRREFEKAIKIIDTAETKYKLELADSYRMIALAVMMEKKTDLEESKKKWETAVNYLKKSLKYKEDVAQAHLLLGQSYQNLNLLDDAIKHYKRVLQLDPKNKEARKYHDDLIKLKE